MRIKELTIGETFIHLNNFYMKTDMTDKKTNDIVCINLKTGHLDYLNDELPVNTIKARLIIL